MQTFKSQASAKNKNLIAAKTIVEPQLQNAKQNAHGEESFITEEKNSSPEHVFANMKIYSPSSPFPKPFQHKMESAFNEDFSSVKVHTNSDKATELNALAFTHAEEIHFAPGQYNTSSAYGQQLIGHELAHITQQRKGIVIPTTQTKGIQINDDTRLEQQASEMGKQAAESSSSNSSYQSKALGIRNNLRTVQRATNNVIQRASFPTFYGNFQDKTYKPISKVGVDIELEFHPDDVAVNATKIGLTQILKSELGGASAPIGPTQAERMVDKGFAEGSYTDRIAERNNPVYGGQQLTAANKLSDTNNAGGNYHLGWNYTDKAGKHAKEAYLHDTPTRPNRGKNSGQIFETTALAIEGAQAGTYYGSVSWGWQTDAAGKFSVEPITVTSKAAPTERFFKAAEKWNAATSLGTIKTIASPTNVYNKSFKKSFTVPKDEVVTITANAINKNIIYQEVTIVSTGKTGRIKTGDLKDQGDGAATTDLPIVTEIYAGPLDEVLDVAPIAQVPRDTKVKLLDNSDPITVHVEVTDGRFLGTRGYVNKIGGIPFTNIVK